MFSVYHRAITRIVDAVILAASFWLSFLLRFDWHVPDPMMTRLVVVWPYAVSLEFLSLWALGILRFSWRHVSLRDVERVAAALLMSTFTLVVLRLLAQYVIADEHHWASVAVVPHGALIINFALAFLGVSGARVFCRAYFEGKRANGPRGVPRRGTRTLLVGAGRGGALVARELAQRPQLGILPIAFVDDRASLRGVVVQGLPVVGDTRMLAELARKYNAEQVLITISTAAGSDVRRIKKVCDVAGLRARIVPGIDEIVSGDMEQPLVRDIVITDLLRRDPVELDQSAIERLVHEQTVLVTGAGGSIGSELCRQLLRFAPKNLILVERAENNLFHIHKELRESGASVIPCLADISDVPRMRSLFSQYRPAAVFHAAAHKHVPMMEWNACEALKNNVFGTRTVADLAHEFEASAFVMISTDKAVNPSSVMGATKRVAEIYIQSLANQSSTRFVTVRFGNVLGSAGSVIPVFQDQIKRGGPVTVTHPEMRRYFMTIPEACQLVVQAASMGQGGEIFILDMGEPVRIFDLARDLIRLSGKEGDVDIHFTGIRPGEKLFEELSLADEKATKTNHPKIFVGKVRTVPRDEVERALTRLWQVANLGDIERARTVLQELVPEYCPVVIEADSTQQQVVRPVLSPVVAEA
jgi:FlaA1/EpsC-like NDP-sugar epimerase